MGSEKFDRNQYRLAWAIIFTGSLIFLFSIILGSLPPQEWGVTTNVITDKAVQYHTNYETVRGYLWGTYPVVFYGTFVVTVILIVWWLYRGKKDNWEFLYE